MILFMLLNLQSHSQNVVLRNMERDIDSLKNDLRIHNDQIRIDLRLCHEQYKTGTDMIIVGTLMGIGGQLLVNKDPSNSVLYVFNIGGALLALTGVIVQIDSHRYIGYAGEIN